MRGFLFFILCLCLDLAIAKQAIVVVKGSDSLVEREDREQNAFRFQMLENWLYSIAFEQFLETKVHKYVEFLPVPLTRLKDLPTSLSQVADPETDILGVVFLGHGNSQLFGFTPRGEGWNGKQVAEITAEALAPYSLSSSPFFYFSACENARPWRKAASFQVQFDEELEKQFASRGGASFQSIAHYFKGDALDTQFVNTHVAPLRPKLDVELFRSMLKPNVAYRFVQLFDRYVATIDKIPYGSATVLLLGGLFAAIVKIAELDPRFLSVAWVGGIGGMIATNALQDLIPRLRSELVQVRVSGRVSRQYIRVALKEAMKSCVDRIRGIPGSFDP